MFNRLTGLQQKVASVPGITVKVASGRFSNLDDTVLVDYPGTYAMQVIRECARRGKRVIVLANMIAVLATHKLSVNLVGLGEELQALVLPISARTGSGVEALLGRLGYTGETDTDPWPHTAGFADSSPMPCFPASAPFLCSYPRIFLLTLVIGMLEDSGYHAHSKP
ncbi:MAG: FeoB small GTPase domain-containing protein [Chromatocurvus sp.]